MKIPSPSPIIDNIDHIENPYRYAVELLPSQIEGLKIAHDLAQQDYSLSLQFLYSYRGSKDTFGSYRRELERLLQWCWYVEGITLNTLRRSHFEAFLEFCQQPPLNWIGTQNLPRFIESEGARIANPDWKPFVSKIDKRSFGAGDKPDPKQFALSKSAVQAIFAVSSSFFNFLIQEEYTDSNPVAQIRQKSRFIRKQQGPVTIRRLSNQQWLTVLDEVKNLAENQTGKEKDKYERMLFIMSCLFCLYLRISELSSSERWQPQMGHFWKDSLDNWWFTTVGKGNKERDVSVSDRMLDALIRYRQFLNLTQLPLPGEATPLLPKQKGRGGISSTRQIRYIVQEAFNLAVSRLEQLGLNEEAESLKLATVHWLRHTGISEDVKTRPREHVRDDAGHGSSAITDRYIDVERQQRHDSAKNKPIEPAE